MTRPEFLATPAPRADGATLTCLYLIAITTVPSYLAFPGIAVTPADVLGVGLGLLVVSAHLTTSLGMAKGRNVVRSAVLLYVASLLFNYGYASLTNLPADELKNMDHKFIIMAAALSMTVLVCDGVRGLARLDVVLRAVVVTGAFVAAVAVLQSRAHIDYTSLFNHVPVLRYRTEFSLGERGVHLRPAGTMGTPIELGVLCSMVLPLSAVYGFRAQQTGQRMWFWWGCCGLVFAATFLSLSRSAILGLAAAGAVMLIGLPARRRLWALLVGMVGLVALKFMVPGMFGTLLGLFTNFSNDPSVQWRTHDYPIAAKEIAQHPWLGRGNWTFYATKHEIFDNQYLLTLLEGGVIGLLALLVLFGSGIYAASRARWISQDPEIRELGLALTAALIVPVIGSYTYDLLSFGAVTGLTFVLLGAAGSLLRTARDPGPAAVRPPPLTPFGPVASSPVGAGSP